MLLRTAKGGKGSITIEPDTPREAFVQGAELVSAVSQAVCVAGACAEDIPVYQHIANTYYPQVGPFVVYFFNDLITYKFCYLANTDCL